MLKSVSESKLNSWFHGVHLYDSTFNWKGLEAFDENLTETTKVLAIRKHVEAVSLFLSVLLAVFAKVWDLRQSETKRDFPDPFILG